MAIPVPSPELPDDFEDEQGYLQPSDGVGAEPMWSVPGGTGSNVSIADIEYDWDTGHYDLQKSPEITVIRPGPGPKRHPGRAVE